jgi:hypothetical protein
MHRSGTSALTRVLNLLGAVLPADVLPPQVDGNELGSWEPRRAVELNDEALETVDLTWDDVGPLPVGWFRSPAAGDFRRRATALLREEYVDHPFFVLKDPRISRLYPVWRDAVTDVGAAPLPIHIVRHPLEVAASLSARDGFSVGKSLLLWLRYVLESEFHTRGGRRAFVLYADLLRDWRRELSRVSVNLGLAWSRDTYDAHGEIDNFLSARHRHHEFRWSELSARPDVARWVRDAFDAMRASAVEESEQVVERLDAIRLRLAEADLAFGPIHAEERKWRGRASTNDQELRRISEEACELRRLVDVSTADATAAREQIDRLISERDEAKRARDAAAFHRDSVLDELANARGEEQGRTKELAGLRAEVAELQAMVELFESQLDEERSNGAQRAQEAQLAAESLGRLEASNHDLRKQLGGTRDEVRRLERERAVLHAQQADATVRYSAATEEVEALRAANGDLQSALSRLEDQRANDRAELDELRASQGTIDALRAETIQSKIALEEHGRLVDRLQHRVTELCDAKNAAAAHALEAQRGRDLAHHQTARLRARLVDFENARGSHVAALERLRSELRAAAESATEAHRRRMQAEKVRDQVTQDLARARDELAARDQETDSLRGRLRTLRQESAQALSAVEANLGTTRRNLHEAELRAESAAARAEEIHRELASAIRGAEESASAHGATISELREEADSLARGAATLAAELQKMVATAHVELQRRIESDSKIDSTIAELERVHRRFTVRELVYRRLRVVVSLTRWCLWPSSSNRSYIASYWRLLRGGAFDSPAYRARYWDVADSRLDSLLHYVQFGMHEGRFLSGPLEKSASEADPSALAMELGDDRPLPSAVDLPEVVDDEVTAAVRSEMDTAYYLDLYPDVAESGIDPVEHFVETGWLEGRDPHPEFSTSYYLEMNADIAGAGVNPYFHYIAAGRDEGRLSMRPGGFRLQILESLAPLDVEIANWRGSQLPPHAVLTRDQLRDDLRRRISWSNRFILAVGHDDYTQSVGGVQLCVGLEQAEFGLRGLAYVHVFPHQPLPVLAAETNPEGFLLTLVCDGECVGTADASDVIAVLRDLAADVSVEAIVVHALHGHSPEVVAEMYRAAKPRTAWFWIHDYFSLCPGYTLMRNQVEYCHGPPPDSAACRLCIFGAARVAHLPRIETLFSQIPFTFVAPSAAAADVWQKGWGASAPCVVVHEHCTVEWTTTGPALATVARADPCLPVRIAFIGYPSGHKGWNVYADLARRFGRSDAYRFLQFGLENAEMPWIEHVSVAVTPESPTAMLDALVAAEVDVTILWSLWPETFSFALHEALAAGTFVVTNPDAGNIARVTADLEGHGVVLRSEEDLLARFSDGTPVEWARRRADRQKRLGRLVRSHLTADLVPAIEA